MVEMNKDVKATLKKVMHDFMVDYYKSEIAYVKQINGLLDHVNEKQNLLSIKKTIDNKLNK